MMHKDLETIGRCWDSRSAGFDAAHSEENLPLWSGTLKELIGVPEGLSALDVGTGTGFLAQLLCRLGCRTTGADISGEMLSLARQKAASQGLDIAYTQFDGGPLPWPGESFDLLTNSRLLWTLLEPEKTFREWRRVLKPGGLTLSFMRLPKPHSGKDPWCYSEELELRLPLKYAGKAEIAAVFTKAGFSSVEIIDLAPDLSTADLPPWYCIRCVK